MSLSSLHQGILAIGYICLVARPEISLCYATAHRVCCFHSCHSHMNLFSFRSSYLYNSQRALARIGAHSHAENFRIEWARHFIYLR